MMRMMLTLSLLAAMTVGCGRTVRYAKDVTPGNPKETQLDWRYGSNDVRIQTTKINKQLMDRWYAKTGYQTENGKPRVVFTQIDNRTDTFIPSDMIRDIIEGVAINDGRYSVTVGDEHDEKELDRLMDKIQVDPKYANSTRLWEGQAKAPQFLAKMRITKAKTAIKGYDLEDYRMTVTLYDVETQEAIDSAWDVLRKQVRRR